MGHGYTYIRTCEGFAYVAVVIDLYCRRVIGWAMQSRKTTYVVLQALLMAVWRRKPRSQVLIHSDQGLAVHQHEPCLVPQAPQSRSLDEPTRQLPLQWGAESFFNLLEQERIRRRVYRSRDEARQDVFDYIEMFDNPKREHVRNGMLSPIEFKKRQKI